jgi:hypothetical protein
MSKNTKIKKKVGRKKGQIATKNKYLIEVHNIKDDTWDELGRFPSLRKASKELDLSYGLLSDLNIGRRKIYNNFYRVVNMNKHEKTELKKELEILESDEEIEIPEKIHLIEIPEGINLDPEKE